MRRLILLRHAKSDWPKNVRDHDRPLAARGREQAPMMGRYLAGELIIPDLAIVSTARRAQETWRLFAEMFDEAIKQRDEPDLFAATADAIIGVAQGAPPEARAIILVGHNPGMHESALRLAGHGDRYAFVRLKDRYPTSGLTILDFAVDAWSEIEERGARLDRFVTPKTLGGEDVN